MTLKAGQRLGPYEILTAIGAGGMGEVYKARDTRLDRTVAIKVLPSRFANDPQFRERFEREAKSVSKLTHPNICTLHDIGTDKATGTEDIDFLVLEYLDGQTLTTRLQRGPLPVPEAIRIASDVASALESAHRQGIVHRDLKPGNIMLTKTGAKLLDFGLAKIARPPSVVSATAAGLPTEAATITTEGTILGTLQYMAPEQIEGREVDARADLFALGTVLYEMLTGRPPFRGDSHASLLGSILKDEPPSISAQRPIPSALDYLVRTCLAKDPDERIQTAHDVLLQLKWAAESLDAAQPAATAAGARPRRMFWIAGLIGAAALVGFATWRLKPGPAETRLAVRFQHVLPENQSFTSTIRHVIAISPDGTKVLYVANRRLYLRDLNQLDANPIGGTDEGSAPGEPVFSPDGESIAYFTSEPASAGGGEPHSVRRIPIAGGTSVIIGRGTGLPFGASWRNGMIVVGRGSGGIEAIPESGGQSRTIVTVKPNTERAVQPHLLDDGKHIVFVMPSPLNIGRETASGEGPIVVQAIDSGARKVLVDRGSNPHVLSTGHLLYIHDRTLLAVAFDARRLEVTGTPVALVQGVAQSGLSGAGQFAVSRSGSLVYVPGGFTPALRQLAWVDRKGHEQTIVAPPNNYQQPRLSPDGTRLAVSVGANISIWSFATDTLMRLTNDAAVQYNLAWTPDGRSVVYDSNDGSGIQILRRSADATGRAEVIASAPAGFPEIVSRDGTFLIYHPPERVAMLLPLKPKGTARPLLPDVNGQVSDAEISPDGRWIVYESNESGRFEVSVRPFPAVDTGRWQVSSNGGQHPLWSRDGRELFFIAADGMMMSVPLEPGATFRHGKPVSLFPAGHYYVNVARNYDVSPDGKRFYMVKNAAGPGTRPSMIVVTRWFDEVRTKVEAQK